jgi:DNA helicase-2/ATP-dependent DNA helicase PcrA
VKLMTVHAAKGLEFPYVFLCGMNEGIFPSRKVRTRQGMEEERRLAFVAVTRAEKGLYLSEADGTNFDGSPRYSSRFLLDMWGTFIPVPEPQEGLLKAARGTPRAATAPCPRTTARCSFRWARGCGISCSGWAGCWTWT